MHVMNKAPCYSVISKLPSLLSIFISPKYFFTSVFTGNDNKPKNVSAGVGGHRLLVRVSMLLSLAANMQLAALYIQRSVLRTDANWL